jgi:hypothetical protein
MLGVPQLPTCLNSRRRVDTRRRSPMQRPRASCAAPSLVLCIAGYIAARHQHDLDRDPLAAPSGIHRAEGTARSAGRAYGGHRSPMLLCQGPPDRRRDCGDPPGRVKDAARRERLPSAVLDSAGAVPELAANRSGGEGSCRVSAAARFGLRPCQVGAQGGEHGVRELASEQS